jgi:hypothetical protein
MRAVGWLAMVVAVAGLLPAAAQGQGEAAAVRAALDRYLARFSSGQIDAIATQSYLAPSINTTADRVGIAMTAADVGRRFEATLATLVPQGYDRSVTRTANVCMLSDVAAVVSATFARLRRDGTVLSEIGSTYVFVKSGDGWRIAAQLAHDPARQLRCAD